MNTTKTAQFTPGPWVTNKNAVVPCIYGPDDNLIATIHPHRKRDINLIAAAPAMYEALKALHSVLDQRMPDGRTLNQHLSREVFEYFYGPAIAARAAIAKAEGA